MKTRKIIIQPVVSEKSFSRTEKDVYTFRVDRNANKQEIKKAIEDMFNVEVVKVNTINRKGKLMVNWQTRNISSRKDFKIAVVKLKEGDTIDIFK
jgi:large subunit ribosomal protein L23